MSYEFDYRDPPEFYNEVVQLAMSGLTLKEIGEYFCLDPDDWIEFCANHCLVELKFQHGKAKGIALAGARLLREVNAGKINAITFYLKTQGNFTEKQPRGSCKDIPALHARLLTQYQNGVDLSHPFFRRLHHGGRVNCYRKQRPSTTA